MTGFGDFEPLCRSVPSYPWCNLFYRQLQRTSNLGNSLPPSTAGVGINPTCFIPPTFSPLAPSPALGNLANVLACALSLLLTLILIFFTHRRKAAVARVELRAFLLLYAITLPLNALTTGSYLHQGSTALVVLTAIHAAIVVALFWALLANSLVATQVVEDGTWSSLVPYYGFAVIVFGLTTYISLDVALGVTNVIGAPANPPSGLRSIPLFILLIIWPVVTALVYLGLMSYIVLRVLNERRPMAFYALGAFLFVLAQLAWLLLGHVLCEASNQRIDGSFLATLLETGTVVSIFFAWRSITEDSWDDEPYYPS